MMHECVGGGECLKIGEFREGGKSVLLHVEAGVGLACYGDIELGLHARVNVEL